ncbi:MAG: hypothetical protein AAB263_11100 [Planctomycetota bacterium]
MISSFSGALTYRFYRLGDTIGGLRVNYSVIPDADAVTTDLVNDDTAFNFLSGYFDMVDGQSYYDLTVIMKSSYVAGQRRNLTIQVDTPTVLGSYTPGQVPGIVGGLGSATCQILKSTDTNVVKLSVPDAAASEGSVDTAQVRVSANVPFSSSQSLNLTAVPVLTTADSASDYALNTALTLTASATAVNSTLTAPRDYLISEGDEFVVVSLDQPVGVGPVDPPYFVVGIPGVITIHDGPAPQADIAITRAAFDIADGSTEHVAGVLIFGTPVTYAYTISNTGELPLHLSGFSAGSPINLGSVTTDTSAVPSTIAAGASYDFTGTVTPLATGSWRLPMAWSSDDPDEAPMNWTITGFAAETASSTSTAELQVKGTASNGCGMGNLLGLILGSCACLGLRRKAHRA